MEDSEAMSQMMQRYNEIRAKRQPPSSTNFIK